MSNFIKYQSIENHYQKNNLDYFVDLFPDLKNCKFTIEAKLHRTKFIYNL